MAIITNKCTIPMAAKNFWEIFYEDEFEQFMIEYVSLKSIDIISSTKYSKKENIIKRKLKVTPWIPPGVRQIITTILGQPEIVYIDTQKKYLDKYKIIFRTYPPIMKDKIKIKGLITLDVIDDNSCNLILYVKVVIPIPIVGPLIELAALSELKKSFNAFPGIVEKWKKKISPNIG